MYRPLPDYVTIRESPIAGLGLFATEDIDKGTSLGVSHIKNTSGKFEDNYIRTPLGGSINHSDDPNCIKFIPDVVVAPDIKISPPQYMSLKTIKDIKRGEELTVTYTLYSIEENDIYDDPIIVGEDGGNIRMERV